GAAGTDRRGQGDRRGPLQPGLGRPRLPRPGRRAAIPHPLVPPDRRPDRAGDDQRTPGPGPARSGHLRAVRRGRPRPVVERRPGALRAGAAGLPGPGRPGPGRLSLRLRLPDGARPRPRTRGELAEPRHQVVRRQGPPEVVALAEVAAELAQPPDLLGVLDPL